MTRPLSKSARDARKPLPPEVLAGARQETVHVESGKWRVPRSMKVNEWSRVMPCGVVVRLQGDEVKDDLPHYLGLDARTELLAAKVDRHRLSCKACLRAMQGSKCDHFQWGK